MDRKAQTSLSDRQLQMAAKQMVDEDLNHGINTQGAEDYIYPLTTGRFPFDYPKLIGAIATYMGLPVKQAQAKFEDYANQLFRKGQMDIQHWKHQAVILAHEQARSSQFLGDFEQEVNAAKSLDDILQAMVNCKQLPYQSLEEAQQALDGSNRMGQIVDNIAQLKEQLINLVTTVMEHPSQPDHTGPIKDRIIREIQESQTFPQMLDVLVANYFCETREDAKNAFDDFYKKGSRKAQTSAVQRWKALSDKFVDYLIGDDKDHEIYEPDFKQRVMDDINKCQTFVQILDTLQQYFPWDSREQVKADFDFFVNENRQQLSDAEVVETNRKKDDMDPVANVPQEDPNQASEADIGDQILDLYAEYQKTGDKAKLEQAQALSERFYGKRESVHKLSLQLARRTAARALKPDYGLIKPRQAQIEQKPKIKCPKCSHFMQLGRDKHAQDVYAQCINPRCNFDGDNANSYDDPVKQLSLRKAQMDVQHPAAQYKFNSTNPSQPSQPSQPGGTPPPVPTTPAPFGKKYVLDPQSNTYVLVDANQVP